jgi:TRAP-type C4-dicarboxylate transport system permease small subunit
MTRRAWVAGLARLDGWVSGLALGVACVLLAVISVLGLWQVLARFVFSQPSTWTEEAMRRLLIWMVMLGTVYAFRRGALVSVDLMLVSARGAWKSAVRGLVTGVSIAFLGVLVWYGADLSWRVRFQTFASMELSMAWAYAALPVGAALAIVAVLGHHFDPVNEELEAAQ